MEIQNSKPPFGEFLSGKYEKSFAYTTIKDRLPVIITSIIDNISQSKDSIITKYGSNCSEELKHVIGQLSELKSELMTNKPLKLINSCNSEKDGVSKWNACVIQNQQSKNGSSPTWFNSVWLFSECYMYRRIAQIFSSTCDLSLSQGLAVDMENLVDQIKTPEENILIDHSDLIWTHLIRFRDSGKDTIIDIVLDNAGYELFTDFCIAAFLIEYNFTKKIRFHVKSIPWFVSDVTERDFSWTINTMKDSNHEQLMRLGHCCSKYLEENKWTVEVESFWTEPYDYSQLKSESPKLYKKLSEAALIIFKGDLNYRKLIGDINWDHETDLKTALRGFEPSNIVTLRTIKSDLVVGVPHKKVNELSRKQENWMVTGQYGLIHSYFINPSVTK